MFPYIPLGDWLLLDSWRVMITVGFLGGSLVSFFLLQGELGRFRACLLVASMVLGALFGAHLAHRLLHPGISGWNLQGILVFWRDGYSLLGALAFCALLLIIISRIVPEISFWPTADAFSLGAPVGLFFARIGCYMKGCCWGTPIGGKHPFHGLSVKLVRNDLLTLHPVQLYSAAAALTIFCILLTLRRRTKTPGLLAVLFLLLYAAARFILEFFRGDTSALFAGLTLYQGICVLLFLAGTVLL
ncbi:MAG: prolipoprotein diacylglyceryl transferase, partial [Thermodesulfobacteriota bacterium]